MRQYFFITIAALAALLPARAKTSEIAEAIATVERYSEAFSRFDCQALLKETSPRVKESIARQGGTELFCAIIDSFEKDGVKEEIIREVQTAASGEDHIVLVPNRRTRLDAVNRKRFTQVGTYVVHSSDGGKTWYVLDVGCLDEKWLRVVYPAYAGTPRVSGSFKVETLP